MEEISSLVIKAKNGDNTAFDRLYYLTQQEVWFTCISLLKNETHAEEIMQNTYVTAIFLTHTGNLAFSSRVFNFKNAVTYVFCIISSA